MTKNRNKINLEIFNNSKNKKIYFEYAESLLSDCKKFGAINFVSMARIAFIGNIMLKSLREKNVIDENFVNEIMSSISSPLLEIQNDLDLYSKKKLSKKEFLSKYGHLRPGTYDITAERYDENEEFLKNIKFLKKSKLKTQTYQRNIRIKNALKNNGISVNDKEFIIFLKESIRLREVLKFEFTKNLSDALSLITKGGKNFGFSKNELAYLELKNIFSLKKLNEENIYNYCKKKIIKSKKRKKINEFLIMSPLIFSENDFEVINYNLSKPNFITMKKITAEIEKITNMNDKNIDFSKKIIFIENADPGYDWIFTKNPAALITKYGGIASHMAIRCAELGLPAAIGIGEIIFQKIDNAKKILLDCENQQIILLENLKNEQYIDEKRILKSLGYIK
jgi:phosphohistidine swiveling domain-containing protein